MHNFVYSIPMYVFMFGLKSVFRVDGIEISLKAGGPNDWRNSWRNKDQRATQMLLVDLRKRGFKALTGMRKEEQQKLWLWAQKVSGQYGKALSRNPWNLKKVSELPIPKEDIKLAIKLMLLPHIIRGRRKVVRVSRDRYADLASFQEIDEKDRDTLSELFDSRDRKSNQLNGNKFPLISKYAEKVVSERKHLIEDINDFINNI